MGGDREAGINERTGSRLSKASQVATWENEGGGVPDEERVDSSRDKELQETSGPFELNELARVTLNSIADAVISTDCDGNVAYMNATAIEMTGWTFKEAFGRTLADVFTVIDATTGEPVRDPGLHAVAEGHAVELAHNSVLIRRDGSELEIEDSAAPIHDKDGRMLGAVMIFRDVRFSHAMVDRMLYLARQDPLTGQANRFALDEQFDLARRMAKRHHWKIGVLFIDIDRFKSINDNLGHDVGDEVLVTIAQRLHGCLRDADTLSRYGGDEFVVLLAETRQAGDAALVAKKLQSAVAGHEHIAGQSIDLSLSIGISVYPDDGEDLHALVRQADQEMLQTRAAVGHNGSSIAGLR